MKYAKYILFVVAIILASCTIDEDVTNGKNCGGKIQFMSRIVPFEGYNVFTRATGDGLTDNDIVSLDYVILAKLDDGNNGYNYKCIYYRHYDENANEIITIDVETDFKDLTTKLGDEALAECYVAVLANYPALYGKIVNDTRVANYTSVDEYIKDHIVYKGESEANYKDMSYFTSVVQPTEAISGVPSTGLPRLGNYKNPNGADFINLATLESGKTYEVRLKSLYAKMVFDIKVDSMTQNIIGVNGNTFALKDYYIHNLAKTVDMTVGTESAEGLKGGTDDQVEVHPSPVKGDPTSKYQISERECEFTCYIPERFTQAAIAANDYGYPFAPNGADDARDEDRKLLQRYKPLLAQTDATYITFEGTFVNHQGHSFNVTYKIYVGNDNYSNFDVVRNRQYNNIITIKGIDNSSNQSNITDEDGNLIAVSIDHRVDVQRTLPIIVNLRRETLLDSHFEVRPMRIRANTQHTADEGENFPEGSTPAAKIVVEYPDGDAAKTDPTKRWIGLERSYGGGNENKNTDASYTTGGYCDGNGQLGASSAGKRKYFTTDLTYNTLADDNINNLRGTNGFSNKGGQVVIIPVSSNSECVWIYVDECLEASTDLNATRSAKILVYNGYLNASKEFQEVGGPIEYIVNQHKLFKITYHNEYEDKDYTYYIEHEEEYLYNFDADDNFTQNQTFDEGMKWGLYNTQLSRNNDALFFNTYLDIDFIDGIIKSIQDASGLKPKYDFYVESHDRSISRDATMYKHHGFRFFKNIVTYTNLYNNKLQLDQTPSSAIEYCLNRNKRKADGTIDTTSIMWYLPAIDEIEDICMGGYSSFDVFQEKFYWSCQPAFISNYAYYDIITTYDGAFYLDDIGIYDLSASQKNVQKDVGRARATSVEYKGNEEYETVSSGINGFDNGYRIYYSWGTKLSSYFTGTYRDRNLYDWGTYDPEDETTHMDYHDGNKLRDDKCRVRAVRKMTTTTTN